MKLRTLAVGIVLVLWAAVARANDDDALLVPEGEDVPADLESLGFRWGDINGLGFLPDGRTLVGLWSDWDGPVTLSSWNLATGAEQTRRSFSCGSRVHSMAIAPDGRVAFLCNSAILAGDLRRDEPFQKIPVPQSIVAFGFGPDGHVVIATSAGQYGALGGDLVQVAQSDQFYGAVFSPDASVVAFGGRDRLTAWDVGSHRSIGTIDSSSLVQWTAISSGLRPLVISEGGGGALYDARSGKKVRDLPRVGANHCAFSFDGGRYAISDDTRIRVVDAATGEEIGPPIFILPDFTTSMSASADGDLLALAQLSGEANFWNLRAVTRPWQWSVGLDPVIQAAIAPDVKTAVLVANEKAHLIDVETHKQIWEEGEVAPSTSAAAFSPDGQVIAIGATSAVKMRGSLDQRPNGYASLRNAAVTYLHDGRLLAVSPAEGVLYAPTGAELRRYKLDDDGGALAGGDSGAVSLSVSPDDTVVAIGRMRDALLLNLRIGKVYGVQKFAQGEGVIFVGFLNGGKEVSACEIRAGACVVSDARTGRLLRREPGYGKLLAGGGGTTITQPRPGEIVVEREGRVTRLVNGYDGDWAVIENGRLYRRDHGRLFSRGAGAEHQPVLPPRPAVPPRLDACVEATRPPGEGSASGLVTVKIANQTNTGRAYWVRVAGKNVPPGLNIWTSQTVMRIEPGTSRTVDVRISALRAGMPTPADLAFELVVTHAFGEGPTIPVELHVRAPVLHIVAKDPQINGNQSNVSVDVVNVGDQATSGKITGWIAVGDHKEALPNQDLADLAAGAKGTYAVAVPAFVKRQKFLLHLEIAGSIWPTHVWSKEISLRATTPAVLYGAIGILVVLLGAAVYFFRVYRDPVVSSVARRPEAIRQFSLRDLRVADTRLRRANRLEGALAAAGVSAGGWQRAVQVSTRDSEPEAVARAFTEAIGAELEKPIGGGNTRIPRAWKVHLPPLRLRFAQSSAVTVLTGEILEPGPAVAVAEHIRDNGKGPTVAIAIDLTRAQNAASVLKEVPQVVFVTLDGDALRDLLVARQPRDMLEEALAHQRPVVELSPYQVGGGVEDEELFFGREKELRLMADRRPRNVLLVGPRQMGKTSLLKAVARRMKGRDDVAAQFLLMTGSDLTAELSARADGAHGGDLRRLVAGTKERPRLWLIDEADAFAKADARAGHPMAAMMRALAEEGVAYFVLAGYWDLYRTAVMTSLGPFRNFGEVVRLGPLDRAAARDLVTKPMSSLRLAYDSEATVERLLDETGCRANLLSVACNALIQTLDPARRVVSAQHLERVLHEHRPLHDELKFWRASPTLDRLLVRAALDADRPTAAELEARLARRGVKVDWELYVAALERLEMSYILTTTLDNRLHCPIPVLEWFIRREPEEISMLASQISSEPMQEL